MWESRARCAFCRGSCSFTPPTLQVRTANLQMRGSYVYSVWWSWNLLARQADREHVASTLFGCACAPTYGTYAHSLVCACASKYVRIWKCTCSFWSYLRINKYKYKCMYIYVSYIHLYLINCRLIYSNMTWAHGRAAQYQFLPDSLLQYPELLPESSEEALRHILGLLA